MNENYKNIELLENLLESKRDGFAELYNLSKEKLKEGLLVRVTLKRSIQILFGEIISPFCFDKRCLDFRFRVSESNIFLFFDDEYEKSLIHKNKTVEYVNFFQNYNLSYKAKIYVIFNILFSCFTKNKLFIKVTLKKEGQTRKAKESSAYGFYSDENLEASLNNLKKDLLIYNKHKTVLDQWIDPLKDVHWHKKKWKVECDDELLFFLRTLKRIRYDTGLATNKFKANWLFLWEHRKYKKLIKKRKMIMDQLRSNII